VHDILAVYDSANGYVTGHARFTPTATDSLPIPPDTPANPNQPSAQVVVGFTNLMAGSSTTPSTGSFDLRYVVKNNHDEVDLSSTSVTWLVVPDSTHAKVLGYANLIVYEPGTVAQYKNVAVRFDISLGDVGHPGHVIIRIYEPAMNPNTGTPTWIMDDDLATNSNVMIRP